MRKLTTLNFTFNENEIQTTSLEAMASKVQSYCENLKKFDATHGVLEIAVDDFMSPF